MTVRKQLKRDILEAVSQWGEQGARRADLRKALDCRGAKQHAEFKEAFRELLEEGELLRKRGGRYLPTTSVGLVAGTLSVITRGGFGFVSRPSEPETPDIFIPPGSLGGAISGDTVLVRITDESDDRGPSGRVAKVTERRHSLITGCLSEDRAGLNLRPMLRELPERIILKERQRDDDLDGAKLGDWILAKLLPQDGERDDLQAVFVKRIGQGGDVTAELDAVVTEFELPEPYSEQQNQAAQTLQPVSIEREDARHLTIVTIDPEDAKDFDDAISIEKAENGNVIVGVHIADVAAFVTPGSELDGMAAQRGFTHYLPGRTIPMLPRPLAAERCSLTEGIDTEAHSVFMTIDPGTGETVGYRRIRTTICVSKRLSFDQVRDFLVDGQRPGAPAAVCNALERLANLAETLRNRRRRGEAFLELHVPEVRLVCSENPPRIQGVKRVEPNPAHELVEEFMLAANTAVARELAATGTAGVFRNHAEPSEADLAEFANWVKGTLETQIPNLSDRRKLNDFLGSIADSPLRAVVLSSFLKALPRARYSEVDSGHYGLGKDSYCHFTSPIRRYPDLVVHQQLLALDQGKQRRSAEDCKQIAERASGAEETADSAYYAALDRLKTWYIIQIRDQDPGRLYEGIVANVSAEYLLVYIDDFALYGKLETKRLGDERFRRDRKTGALHGDSSGKIYRNGDVIYVQIQRVNPARGELFLRPARGAF